MDVLRPGFPRPGSMSVDSSNESYHVLKGGDLVAAISEAQLEPIDLSPHTGQIISSLDKPERGDGFKSYVATREDDAGPSRTKKDKAAPEKTEQESDKTTPKTVKKEGPLSRLFILSSDPATRKEATALERVGHAFLGLAKLALAATIGYAAYKLQLLFLAGAPLIIGMGAIFAIGGIPVALPASLLIIASPTLIGATLIGFTLKSSYHDFKIAITGRA